MYYDELFISSQCACCQQEITGFGVECAECRFSTSNIPPAAAATTKPIVRVRLCVGCFDLGAEVGPHKADHKYTFFDASGNLIIFPNEHDQVLWTARETIRLLDAIEQYGFGNWHDISKHVESKSAAECKEEYVRRFVKGSIGKKTWIESPDCLDKYSKAVHVDRPKDHTTPDEGPLSPSLTQKLQPLDIAEDEVTQLGYMANRDDYEKEYDNDAEKLVCNLDFIADDEEVDVSLKLSLVDMYTRRLRERVRRKRVIRDYQLVSQFFKKERAAAKETRAKRRFHPYEMDITEKLKPFAQFHTSSEHEHFIYNLVREKELMFRLQELYKYRTNGITNQDDCLEYERLKNRKKSAPSLSNVEEGALGDSSLRKGSKTTMMTKSQTQGQMTLPNYTTSQNNGALGNPVSGDENSISHIKSHIPPPFSCVVTNSSYVESKSVEPCSRPTGQLLKKVGKGLLTVQEEGNQKQSYSQHQGEQKVLEDPFTAEPVCLRADLQDLPSFDLISYSEQNLCLRLSILPADYLKFKLALVLEPTVVVEQPVNIDNEDWNTIQNFISSRGWIKRNF